jgi:plastocyanin
MSRLPTLSTIGPLLCWASLCATPANAVVLSDAERAEICREAESRYRAVFGKAPGDEPFIVVLMFKDNFCPQSLTVRQGARVRWVNVDRRTTHSVWFKDAGKPESDRAFSEEAIDMTIDWPPGEYPYLCGPHWEKEGMVGRLTVTGGN